MSMRTSIFLILLLVFSSNISAQSDKKFILSELKRCQGSKNVTSFEQKDSINCLSLVYSNKMKAEIRISKEQIESKVKGSQNALHKMSFKYEIDNANNVFDNKHDKTEILNYINEKISDYNLTMYPFLSEAYDNALTNMEEGKDVEKNINGFKVSATNDFFKGKIEISIHMRKNNGIIIFVSYEISFDA